MIHESYQTKLQDYIAIIENGKMFCSMVANAQTSMKSFFKTQITKYSEDDLNFCIAQVNTFDLLRQDFEKIKNIENNELLSQHFKNYLITEFINFNYAHEFNLINDRNLEQYKLFIQKISNGERVFDSFIVSNFVRTIS